MKVTFNKIWFLIGFIVLLTSTCTFISNSKKSKLSFYQNKTFTHQIIQNNSENYPEVPKPNDFCIGPKINQSVQHIFSLESIALAVLCIVLRPDRIQNISATTPTANFFPYSKNLLHHAISNQAP